MYTTTDDSCLTLRLNFEIHGDHLKRFKLLAYYYKYSSNSFSLCTFNFY